MPYYKWSGINLAGIIKKGTLFARSSYELQATLLESDIGLIQSCPSRFEKRIKKIYIFSFIKHLIALLEGGVRLDQALKIVQDTTSDTYLKDIIGDIKVHVEQGESFACTLRFYPQFFNYFIISLVEVGEATGNIHKALQHYLDHAEYLKHLNQQLTSALVNPLVTLIFFIFTTCALLAFIVPQFESIFATFKEPLPYSTELILSLSAFITSISAYYIVLIFLVMLLFLIILLKKERGMRLSNKLVLTAFFIKNISILIYRAQVLYMIAILLERGVRIVDALAIVSKVLKNKYIALDLFAIKLCIEEGLPLSIALQKSTYFKCIELISVIAVGESSGDLIQVIKYSAILYQQDAYRKLKHITTLIQPLLLLILGFLIAGLIFALYIPLFNLSTIIS